MARVMDGNEALAEVRAEGITTRYRRAGSGSPVLLLCDAADERYWTMLRLLAAGRCVIAPEGADGGEGAEEADAVGAEEWLRLERLTAFLDGLGLGAVPVVGLGRAAGPAAALARLHPDRVERLVLLGEENGDAAGDAAAALAALEREGD